MNQHLASAPQAAFFAIVSPIQIVGGIAFIDLPRRLDPLWLLFAGFLIAAFIVTRTVTIWPIGVVEDVDPLGLISKVVEVAAAVVLISVVRANNAKKPDLRSASPANGP